MHNIKFIRKNPQKFDEAMVKRGLAPASAEILKRDKEVRGDKTTLQDLQQQANEAAKQIGMLKAKGEDADEFIKKSKELKEKIASVKKQMEENSEDESQEIVDDLLYTLPNILDDSVPEGVDETENVEIRKHGDLPEFKFKPKDHWEIGENLGLMNFEQTAKISGSRFVALRGDLARLERAIADFMVSIHTQEFGFELVSAPLLVRSDAMLGAGQLPKFAEDAFKTTNDYWLIPTAEVSLVNMVRESIIQPEELPLRFVAHTPCFRSEAGAAGRDTRGMIRQHQFWKVELVSITTPDQSNKEHDFIVNCAEQILTRLEIPYRTVLLCSGDTGFSSTKTYDIEAWLPGQDKYREISSCSNCKDFQARRMNARYRLGENQTESLHTLNGSGLAVGRTLIAVMENYQQEDGSIVVPHALRPFMGGQDKIAIKQDD